MIYGCLEIDGYLANAAPAAPIGARRSAAVNTPSSLDRAVLWSALRAKPPENEFTFANDPLAEGSRGRRRHVVPLNVFHIATAVANEVMMQQTFRIEARGSSLNRHFPHQAGLYQVTQIVIGRGPGRARIHAIYGFENFNSRGMTVLFHQEGHHCVALRSAPQPAAFQ
jgi:hypothetical protein